MELNTINGFLNIHKPSGISSFDVIRVLRRLILAGERPTKRLKFGHAGTLDPLADGVLVVALGQATKLISYVQNQKKKYRGTFQLGFESDSEDTETELRPVLPADSANFPPSREALEAVLPEFTGTILQRPPLYSALKIDGKRAYRLARQGKEIELPAREIEIIRLKVAEYAFPKIVLEIECGSGTYVRSLGRDLGRRLGSGMVMSALTRTAVGVFHLDKALKLPPYLDEAPPEELPTREMLQDALQPLTAPLVNLQTVLYAPENRRKLQTGIPVRFSNVHGSVGEKILVLDSETNTPLAICQLGADGYLRSEIQFAPAPGLR